MDGVCWRVANTKSDTSVSSRIMSVFSIKMGVNGPLLRFNLL